jgi:flagellar biosynthesis protein FlhG
MSNDAKPVIRPAKSSNGHSASGESLGSVIPIRAARQPIAPTVVAITSGKGGVGKTNVAVNLALAIAQSGARVLCVDADLGLANMDIVMGLTPRFTTAELIRGDATIDEVLTAGPYGVWLLPGGSGQFDLANLSEVQRHHLFAAVDTLEDRFDAVVVDTGAGLGSNALGFAAAAKDIVIVVTPEPTSVADACAMLIALSTRCAVHRVKVLTNMVSTLAEGEQVFRRFTSLASRFLDVGLEYVGAVPRDTAVGRAIMRSEPVLTSYPQSSAATAFRDIANTLLADGRRDDREGAMRLFWRRLLLQGTNP